MKSMTRRSWLAGASALLGSPAPILAATPQRARWWREAVFYQVYPRSFMDSNGDGIGDLPGIVSRLDHIASLGVDAVWLSPHFDSPDADNGYDIRDYRKVHPRFGTMRDFEALLDGLRRRSIRLIIDLVVNHTSDEHEWFRRSASSRDDPYRDFYIWRDGRGDAPPNNYPSFFGGSAWERHPATGQWYLHYFHRKQPDLNWANPRVREAVHDVMRFWLDKGVSGFRMDVIPFIAKQPGLPDLTDAELRDGAEYVYAKGPELHAYLHELRTEVLDRYDAVAIGEGWGVRPDSLRAMVDQKRGELDMVLSSDIADVGRAGWRSKPWTLPQLKAAFQSQDDAPGPNGWNSLFLGNHDYPRMLSHFGDDHPEWRDRSAKALATLLLTQRATPFIYQGDEIGMANFPWSGIEQFNDVSARARWREWVDTGKLPAATVLAELGRTSRDNGRTPMQWSSEKSGGFTTGEPWLPVNPDHRFVNAADQAQNAGSILRYYQQLMKLRRAEPNFRSGNYKDLLPEHPYLFMYQRYGSSGSPSLVIINFSRKRLTAPLPQGVQWRGLLSSRATPSPLSGASLELEGWDAMVLGVTSA